MSIYFLTAEEIAEKVYQVVRRNPSVYLNSHEMADSMIEFIRLNHYHVVSGEIIMACHDRTGALAGNHGVR